MPFSVFANHLGHSPKTCAMQSPFATENDVSMPCGD
jgi:hypothetical protein